jgi:hypothetical protein
VWRYEQLWNKNPVDTDILRRYASNVYLPTNTLSFQIYPIYLLTYLKSALFLTSYVQLRADMYFVKLYWDSLTRIIDFFRVCITKSVLSVGH